MSITSQIRYTRALDNTATDGSGKTALAFGDITAKYLVMGGTLTSLTTETITTLGTYQAPTSAAHLRIKEVSSSDPCKGVYEIHFHNTQVASSGVKLWLFLSASGTAFQPMEVDLSDVSGRLPAALSGGNMKSDVDTIKTNPVVNAGTITFPIGATLASTTNITAGTITTTTNLTNLPAVTADWLTGTGVAASAVTKVQAGLATPTNITAGTITTTTNVTTVNGLASGVITATSIAADAITAAKIADGAIDTATFASGATIPRVTLADTLTTYTGNTPQTGDAFARIGATGSGLTSLAPSSTALSTAVWTGTKAGFVDAAISSVSTGGVSAQDIADAVSAQVTTDHGSGSYVRNTEPDNATIALIAGYTDSIEGRLPASLVGGRMDVSVGAVASGVIATASFAAGATIPRVTLADTATTLTNLPAIATDWLTGAGVAASAVTKIQSGLSTYAGGDTSGTATLMSRLTALRAGYLDNLSGGAVALASGVTVTTNSDKTGYALTVTPPTAASIVSVLLGTSGLTVRTLDSVGDSSMTVGDCLVAAMVGGVGQEDVIGTAYRKKTPAGTTIMTFLLDDADTPTSRT